MRIAVRSLAARPHPAEQRPCLRGPAAREEKVEDRGALSGRRIALLLREPVDDAERVRDAPGGSGRDRHVVLTGRIDRDTDLAELVHDRASLAQRAARQVLVEHELEMHGGARLTTLDHGREDLLHHAHVATEPLQRLGVVVDLLLGERLGRLHGLLDGLLRHHRVPRLPPRSTSQVR